MKQLNLETTNAGQSMRSRIGSPLTIVVMKSNEPIEKLGVTTYQGLIRYGDLSDHFPVESNSDVLGVEFKRQRDVKPARVKGLMNYWEQSAAPVFPEICLFVNDLNIVNTISAFGTTTLEAVIEPEFDRFICDGQGRTTFIEWLMKQDMADVNSQFTLAFKLLVTHTPDLICNEASTIIKQVFADYHVSLIKPNKSISRNFNTGTPFDRLCKSLSESVIVKGKKLAHYLGLHGDIARGNVWTYDQYCSMLQRFLNVTPASANKSLAKPEVYDKMFSVCTRFLTLVLAPLPLETLDVDNYTKVHDESMFTKAIFAFALGYVGRSVMEHALTEGVEHYDAAWAKLSTELSMPLTSKNAPFWLKSAVTLKDGDAIKINRSSERRIGALICREISVFPCEPLLAS